jgi:hypothetical protein
MRLNEFTADYISTDADTTDCLRQIERLRTHSVEDDDAPTQPRPKQCPPHERAKPSDAQ